MVCNVGIGLFKKFPGDSTRAARFESHSCNISLCPLGKTAQAEVAVHSSKQFISQAANLSVLEIWCAWLKDDTSVTVVTPHVAFTVPTGCLLRSCSQPVLGSIALWSTGELPPGYPGLCWQDLMNRGAMLKSGHSLLFQTHSKTLASLLFPLPKHVSSF